MTRDRDAGEELPSEPTGSKSRRDYLRVYQAKWMRSRRRQWFKENGPCRECGSDQRLELDHIDPSQKVHHRVWSWSEERRLAELAKCQVLCRACHLEKTRFEFSRRMKGNRNGATRLNPDLVLEILKRVRAGEGVRAVARIYNIDHSTVSAIKTGKLWRSVTGINAKPVQLDLFARSA